jgi:hypothetical protein
MMAIQYAALFHIECLHGYFGGARCRSLVLTPSEDCRALLERYRMLFRQSSGGAVVHAPLQVPPDLLRQFDESVPFTFRLISTEPALDSYTEPAQGETAPPSESLFYFDNAVDHQADVFGSPRRLLHPPGSPFSASAVPVMSKIFNFRVPADASGSILQVVEPLTSQMLWQCPAPAPGVPCPLDLRRLQEGRYALQLDGKEMLKFYLSNRPPAQQWGAISIYVGGLRQAQNLPENCRVLDSAGVPAPKTFTLALESRKTTWRYYIIDPTGKRNFGSYDLAASLRNPTNETASALDIRFTRLPETALIDGRTAWVFESQTQLPFLQSPSTEFSMSLRPSGNGNRGERLIRLPYAQPGSIVLEEGPEPRSMCSEIFVYV